MYLLTNTVVLGDASDDDEEQEELFPESKKPASTETRESRKEREDRLRKMMEDDDGMVKSNASQSHANETQRRMKKCQMLQNPAHPLTNRLPNKKS
jgi:aspartate oxidase